MRLASAATLAVLLCAVEAASVGTIDGKVVDDAGRPVAGATVAAIAYGLEATMEGTRAAAVRTTGPDGAFAGMELPAGTYALTVTAAGRTAAYVPDIAVEEGGGRSVTLTMGGEGLTLSGVVRDLDGLPLSGAEVRAIRISDADGDVFVTTSVDGAYRVQLPVAQYYLFAESGPLRDELRYAMRKADDTIDFRLVPPAEPPAKDVTRWIGENAIPLATVEAGHGFDDMRVLRDVVGDARIVSLGEATHGTREFFRLKHRMLEFLVEEMGFTVFAIEASLPDGLAVNDYVLRGEGDPARALAGLGFWTWDTEEVLDLIHWMRAYNEDPAHARKLEFWGFDMQAPIASVGELLVFLRREDPESVARAETLIDPFTSPMQYATLPAEEKEATRRTLDELDERLGTLAAAAEPSHRDDWALARRHLELLRQGEGMFGNPVAGLGSRDRAMAENAGWILERQGAGAGIVLWAHNAHVTFGTAHAMGTHLGRTHGANVVTFGFAFDHGGFRAVDSGAERRGLIPFEVGSLGGGSLDAALAAAAPPIAALDLRVLPAGGSVARWFRTPRPTRSIGAVFDETNPVYGVDRIAAPQHYDVLLFVAETTPAVGRKAPAPKRGKAAAAANLDFESGELGETPHGWFVPVSAEAGAFRAIVVDDAERGSRAVQLDREGEFRRPASFGNVMQRIDAAPYRGRDIVFRAAVRGSDEPDIRAQLWLRVDRESGGTGFFDNMDDRPIVTPGWSEHEIAGRIDDDAEAIAFGVMLFGKGPVRMDDVSLEVVPRR